MVLNFQEGFEDDGPECWFARGFVLAGFIRPQIKNFKRLLLESTGSHRAIGGAAGEP